MKKSFFYARALTNSLLISATLLSSSGWAGNIPSNQGDAKVVGRRAPSQKAEGQQQDPAIQPARAANAAAAAAAAPPSAAEIARQRRRHSPSLTHSEILDRLEQGIKNANNAAHPDVGYVEACDAFFGKSICNDNRAFETLIAIANGSDIATRCGVSYHFDLGTLITTLRVCSVFVLVHAAKKNRLDPSQRHRLAKVPKTLPKPQDGDLQEDANNISLMLGVWLASCDNPPSCESLYNYLAFWPEIGLKFVKAKLAFHHRNMGMPDEEMRQIFNETIKSNSWMSSPALKNEARQYLQWMADDIESHALQAAAGVDMGRAAAPAQQAQAQQSIADGKFIVKAGGYAFSPPATESSAAASLLIAELSEEEVNEDEQPGAAASPQAAAIAAAGPEWVSPYREDEAPSGEEERSRDLGASEKTEGTLAKGQ